MVSSGGLSPQTGIWSQTFSTSFLLTLILFGCSAPPRYSLIHFLLVTKPSVVHLLSPQSGRIPATAYTHCPSPSHIFPPFPSPGNLGMRWMLWRSEVPVQEICTISVIPGIPLPPASITPSAFNRFLYAENFFCQQKILNWSLCCVAICLKSVSNFPDMFSPLQLVLLLGQEIMLTPNKVQYHKMLPMYFPTRRRLNISQHCSKDNEKVIPDPPTTSDHTINAQADNKLTGMLRYKWFI